MYSSIAVAASAVKTGIGFYIGRNFIAPTLFANDLPESSVRVGEIRSLIVAKALFSYGFSEYYDQSQNIGNKIEKLIFTTILSFSTIPLYLIAGQIFVKSFGARPAWQPDGQFEGLDPHIVTSNNKIFKLGAALVIIFTDLIYTDILEANSKIEQSRLITSEDKNELNAVGESDHNT